MWRPHGRSLSVHRSRSVFGNPIRLARNLRTPSDVERTVLRIARRLRRQGVSRLLNRPNCQSGARHFRPTEAKFGPRWGFARTRNMEDMGSSLHQLSYRGCCYDGQRKKGKDGLRNSRHLVVVLSLALALGRPLSARHSAAPPPRPRPRRGGRRLQGRCPVGRGVVAHILTPAYPVPPPHRSAHASLDVLPLRAIQLSRTR